MNEVLVSIIIPIYNVEKYIERCARSLYEQTYINIEYIWVNDGTPDRSVDLLKRIIKAYPNREAHVQIIEHPANLGLTTARNTGMSHAKGRYVFHCDSDDWADKDMIEALVIYAEEQQADLVWCDFYKTYTLHEERISQRHLAQNIACIRSLLSEKMHGGYWNKLIRRELYEKNTITFSPKASMCEDLRGSIQLFYYAGKVSYYPKAFYHYVQDNGGSLSANISPEKHLSAFENINSILVFLQEKQQSEVFAKEINYLKLLAKRPYLISTERSNFIKWKDTYPESNSFILSFSALPVSLRILGWFASRGWWFPISLCLKLKKIKQCFKQGK